MIEKSPYEYIDKILFGKWKIILLQDMNYYGCIRFNQTIKTIPISSKVLSEQLQELQEDGLIIRKQYNSIPVKVEYCLSDNGRELMKINNDIYIWIIKYMVDKGVSIDTDAFIVHNTEKLNTKLNDTLKNNPMYKDVISGNITKKSGVDANDSNKNPYLFLGSMIRGKWKMILLHHINHYKYIRFNETLRRLPISKKVLSEQLSELINDELIYRYVHNTKVARVDYKLTKYGETLIPHIDNLYIWALKRMHELDIPIDADTLILHEDNLYSKNLLDVINQIPEYKNKLLTK